MKNANSLKHNNFKHSVQSFSNIIFRYINNESLNVYNHFVSNNRKLYYTLIILIHILLYYARERH